MFAATDTTSNALSRILHLLTTHQDVQDKLRAEILEAGQGQDIPYDQLVELPYLDAVCRETLRLCVTVFETSYFLLKSTYYRYSHVPFATRE